MDKEIPAYETFFSLCSIALVLSGFFLLLKPHYAQAALSACTASVTPTSLETSSTETFTFTITNNDSSNTAVWIRFQTPYQDITITSGTGSGWGVQNSGDAITFVDGSLPSGQQQTFAITAASGSEEVEAQSWTITMSDSSSGTNAITCGGNHSTQISGIGSIEPEISNIAVSNVAHNAVRITFTTTAPATSIVEYGPNEDYGYEATNTLSTTNHTIDITGLSANTTYYYVITAINDDKTSSSEDATFTTALSASATSTPGPTSTPIIKITSYPTPTPAPDTQKPIVTIQKILSTPYKDLPTITGSVIDNGALRNIEYSIDKGNIWNTIKTVTGLASGNATFSFIPTGITTGSWQVLVRARDETGNISTHAITTVLIDQQGPTIALKNIFSQPYKDSPKIEGTSEDPSGESFIKWSLDGTYWQQVDRTTHTSGVTSFVFQLPALDDGNYPITIRSTDVLGNQSQLVAPSLIIDRIPPRVGGHVLTVGPLILAPDSSNSITSLSNITHKITMSIIGGPVQASVIMRSQNSNIPDQVFPLYKTKTHSLWSGELTPTQPSGQYTVWIEALDGAGRNLSQQLFTLSLEPGSRIVDKQGNPISGYVKLYSKDDDTGNFIPWNSLQYGQTNPQTLQDGRFTFYLPQGTYYLEIENKETKERLISTILTHTSTSPFIYTFVVPEKRFGLLNVLRFLPRRQAQVTPYQTIKIDNNTYSNISVTPRIYPSVVLTNEADELSSENLKGKQTTIVIMNSWSPNANAFIEKYRNQKNTAIVFPHESQEQVSSFASRGKYEGSFYADPDGELLQHFSYTSMPSVYTVLPNLEIRK